MAISTFSITYTNLPKGFDPVAFGETLLENPRTKSYHVIDEGEHKILRLAIAQDLDHLKVDITEYLNFEDVQKVYCDAPDSMEKFISNLNKRNLIVLNKSNQENTPPRLPLPKRAPFSICPWIESKGVTVKLSKELIEGMQGKRGADHVVPYSVILQCIEKKSNKLKSAIKNQKRIDFYFNDSSSRTLNLVLSPSSDQHVWHAITAYYMPISSIKSRLNLSDTQLEVWKQGLSNIQDQ